MHLRPLSLSFGDNDRPCGIKPIKSTGTSATMSTSLSLSLSTVRSAHCSHTSPCRHLIGYAHSVVCSASSYRTAWLLSLLLTFCNWCWKLQLWKLGNAQRGWRWLQSALSAAPSLTLSPLARPHLNAPSRSLFRVFYTWLSVTKENFNFYGVFFVCECGCVFFFEGFVCLCAYSKCQSPEKNPIILKLLTTATTTTTTKTKAAAAVATPARATMQGLWKQ